MNKASIPRRAARTALLRPCSHIRAGVRRSFVSTPQPPSPNQDPEVAPDVGALHRWTLQATQAQSTVSDTLRPEHLEDLYITLPTRDGSRAKFASPAKGDPLGCGHTLVFFYPKNPEGVLRADGSDPVFCPPSPFTRRMWAGGRFEWKKHGKDGLCVGDRATAVSAVKEVKVKGLDANDAPQQGTSPMVFVQQLIEYSKEGSEDVVLEEQRTHVYLSQSADRREPRDVTEDARPDASFEFVPSDTTLFRFSALTWNAHKIHLCKEFAQQSEGYPERLVHGPLTALMMLETAAFCFPGIRPKMFEYRAYNPIVVNHRMSIHAAWEDRGKSSLRLWAVDHGDDKTGSTIGMKGRIVLCT